jgi:hypothetical protein
MYLFIRRGNAGVYPCFDMLLLSLNVPKLLLEDPKIVELEMLAIELIIIANVSPLTRLGGFWL